MHPHAPGPGGPASDGGRRGGDVALGRRPRRVAGRHAQPAQEGLAGRADQHRVAQRLHPVEVGQQAPVVRGQLGEAEAGVEHDLLRGARPRPPGPRPARPARGTRRATTSSYDARDCMSRAVPAPVHGDVRHAGAGDHGGHLGVGQAAADVVDERWRRPPAPGGDLGTHRVDRDRAPRRGQLGSTTGRTRRSSSSWRRAARRRAGWTRHRRRAGRRPGRAARSPCATAASGSNHSPPSLKESGVTLTTPITRVLTRCPRLNQRSDGQVRNASASSAGHRDPRQVGGVRVDQEPRHPRRLELGVEAVEALDLEPARGEQQDPPPGPR